MMSSSPPHMNPFYIEPNQNRVDEYYDDDDSYNDTEDLLNNGEPAWANSYNNRTRPRHHIYKDDWRHEEESVRSQRGSILIGCLVIVFLLAVTSVASSREDRDNAVVPVTRIAVLGERNSGTAWLESKLRECYPSIEISLSLQRKGCFFQGYAPDDGFPTTLVVAVFLNSYDWVQRMRDHPVYSPQHNSSLPWETFVTKPWTTPIRPNGDERFSKTKGPICQYEFEYKRIVPCAGAPQGNDRKDYPVYELQINGNGKPYPSIVNLRADKIRNFLQTTSHFNYVSRVVPVQYESLQEMHHHDDRDVPGLWHVLENIQQHTGIEYTCNEILFSDSLNKNTLAPPLHVKSIMTQDYVNWMNTHVDWSAENLVGYTKWKEPPPPPSEEQEEESDDMYNGDDDDTNGNSRDDVNDDGGAKDDEDPDKKKDGQSENEPPQEKKSGNNDDKGPPVKDKDSGNDDTEDTSGGSADDSGGKSDEYGDDNNDQEQKENQGGNQDASKDGGGEPKEEHDSEDEPGDKKNEQEKKNKKGQDKNGESENGENNGDNVESGESGAKDQSKDKAKQADDSKPLKPNKKNKQAKKNKDGKGDSQNAKGSNKDYASTTDKDKDEPEEKGSSEESESD